MDRTERILIGFDFSPCSTLALQYGIDLASAAGAELDILFVEVLHGESLNTANREKMEQLVAQQLILRGVPNLKVSMTVERYFAAAPAILDHAERTDSDLVVLGTHGRRGIRAMMLGSVANEVVRRSPAPVLTVRCRTVRDMKPHKIDSILVPFDFSKHSRRALSEAVNIAQTFGAAITVIHVIEDRFHPAFYGPFFQSIYDLDPKINEKALASLDEEIERLKSSGIEIKAVTVTGFPSTEIAAFAAKNNADLIIMSTHGLTGLERLSFGSVAERTVSSAICPVLTFRNKLVETKPPSRLRPGTKAVLEVSP